MHSDLNTQVLVLVLLSEEESTVRNVYLETADQHFTFWFLF
jgi:hypothetical protein